MGDWLVAERIVSRVLWYPTQAKIRLEWATQPLLLEVGVKAAVSLTSRISYLPATKGGCPIAPIFWGGVLFVPIPEPKPGPDEILVPLSYFLKMVRSAIPTT
jgi:hypothetical protein